VQVALLLLEILCLQGILRLQGILHLPGILHLQGVLLVVLPLVVGPIQTELGGGCFFFLVYLGGLLGPVLLLPNLQGPPLTQANREKIDALKRRTQEITRDLMSRDDVQISYLEMLEDRNNDNLRLAQMLAGIAAD
jgi:hypothetical protein